MLHFDARLQSMLTGGRPLHLADFELVVFSKFAPLSERVRFSPPVLSRLAGPTLSGRGLPVTAMK